MKEYCLGNGCIHRRGCVKYLLRQPYTYQTSNKFVDESKCINSKPMPYKWLDRVLLSTGEPLPK